MKYRMFQHRIRNSIGFLVVSLAALLLFAACGGAGAPPAAAPPAASPTGATTGKTATATLKHVPTGTATLTWTPNNKDLVVKTVFTGLAPNSKHPAHIHSGSCANPGSVIHDLNTITADAHGNATTTTTISNTNGGIPASGWLINVHNGPGMSSADQAISIACADISNTHTSTSSTQTVDTNFTSAPSASTGQNASGMAHLSISGTTLTVTTTLSGLAPNSSHAEHIHSGSCAMQGNIVYPLTTIKADAKGNATTTTTIKNVTAIPSTGWYVNVHNSTDMTNQTSFDPIACGDVKLG